MVKMELAFKNQEFSGIVAGGFLTEDGEVIDYIKTLHARVKELEAEISEAANSGESHVRNGRQVTQPQ